MASTCLERNRFAATDAAHFYGWRRNLVPTVYSVAVGVVYRRFSNETAKNAELVEPDGNFIRFFCALYWHFQNHSYTIVIQKVEGQS